MIQLNVNRSVPQGLERNIRDPFSLVNEVPYPMRTVRLTFFHLLRLVLRILFALPPCRLNRAVLSLRCPMHQPPAVLLLGISDSSPPVTLAFADF